MGVEKFKDSKLVGTLNVACKFDDGSVRYWNADKATVVEHIRRIVDEYIDDGYRLTLRQLHYQFVANVPGYVNHDTAYKKLGNILDDCRYGGIIDWDAIEDRGRVPQLLYWVRDIHHALTDTVEQYRLNRQKGQENNVELWSEKDALSGILSRSTEKYHINLVINKGYTSSTAAHRAYNRFAEQISNGNRVTILYFGDHDPSGLDMVRDIRERLTYFFLNGDYDFHEWQIQENFKVVHIGLTMGQIKQYKLPPNPTKLTDTRSPKYIQKFGKTCWEVDALKPQVLTALIEKHIKEEIDIDLYNRVMKEEAGHVIELGKIVKKYEKDKK